VDLFNEVGLSRLETHIVTGVNAKIGVIAMNSL
jgi:hypothetical protein